MAVSGNVKDYSIVRFLFYFYIKFNSANQLHLGFDSQETALFLSFFLQNILEDPHFI